MKQIIIDTNVLLRFILRDVENQYQTAKKFFIQAKSKKNALIVPQIVIFEIVFNLEKYYKFNKKTIVENVKNLLAVNILVIEDRDIFNLAVKTFEGSSLEFVDCFIIAKAQILQAEIFTFDKAANKLAKT